MRCPYCTTEIADDALVCPQCTRELYLFKPLLEKIARLEQAAAEDVKIATAGAAARIAALEAELAELSTRRPESAADTAPPAGAGSLVATPGSWGSMLGMLVPALVLLVLAHWVLLFVFDVKPIYLRVATLLLPMPFGFALASRLRGQFWRWVGAGFVAALASVFAMLVVTAMIDNVPMLPQDAREWRETVEYVLGIGLAFAAGIMVGEFLPAFREKGSPPHRVMLLVARAVTPDEEGTLGIEKAAKKLDKWAKAATPVATGLASIYAGLKAFLGDPG